MFGYILPDKPNMFMKDYALYKSFYCGMCKSIKCEHGNLLRLSVNYDVTFINIFLHGIMEQKMDFSVENCILNPFKKKCILKTDEISLQCVYFNTLLADFKCRDDIADSHSSSKRFLRFLFRKKTKKAAEKLPEVAELLNKAYYNQCETEKANPSFDRAADPFSDCMRSCFQVFCKDRYTQEIGDTAYFLAKYVYMLDAVDDFEDDIKKKQFNPFALAYPDVTTKQALLEKHGAELNGTLNGILFSIKENYENIAVFETESIITNTLWYGLGTRAKQIFDKENKKCQRTHTKF